ncbi:hypothetical protein PVIIG_06145 [Plasmodium vivax India VII]|uniref:Variable surface protein Vir7-like protein n=1 Tax=Plasmodium vivax India VII TaxID=1077284 RepID=A0A0J9UU66_PLAVI|nr:hypothetical protein PVIIG_06145 [Plasmodium vivax India VII]
MYNKFDKAIGEDPSDNIYGIICDSYVLKDLNEEKNKYSPFCKKLVRNLGQYSHGTVYFNPTFERCDILYNWLYHSLKKEQIPENIIEKCFDDYNSQIRGMTSNYKCSYESYKNLYLDRMKINILNIFYNNISIISQKLMGTDDTNKTHCQEFVCECVKIYKEMYKNHCHNKVDEDPKRILTCSRLDTIKKTYDIFLSGKSYKNYIIPSLDKVEDNYLTMCQPDTPRSALAAERPGTISVIEPTTQYGERKSGSIPPPSPVVDENQGSSMSRTVSTAFGTVAGASSILALLYKVTQNFILIYEQ